MSVNRVLSHLNPNTRYSIRVRTVSRFNVVSEWSEILDIITPLHPGISPGDAIGTLRPILLRAASNVEIPPESITPIEFDIDESIWPHVNIDADTNTISTSLYGSGTFYIDWNMNWDLGIGNVSLILRIHTEETDQIIAEFTLDQLNRMIPFFYHPDFNWSLTAINSTIHSGSLELIATLQGGETVVYEYEIAPPPPVVHVLEDNFTSFNTALWTIDYGDVIIADGVMTIGTTDGFGTEVDSGGYDFRNSEVSFEVLNRGSFWVWVTKVGVKYSNYSGLWVQEDNTFSYDVSHDEPQAISDSIAFSSIQHRWWKIKESNGITSVEVASDGQNWTLLASADSANWFSVDDVYLNIGTENQTPAEIQNFRWVRL